MPNKIKKYLRPEKPWIGIAVAVLLLGAIGALIFLNNSKPSPPADNYSELISAIQKDQVKKIELYPSRQSAQVSFINSSKSDIGIPAEGPDGFSRIIDLAEKKNVEIASAPAAGGIIQVLLRALPTILLLAIIVVVLGMQLGWWRNNRVESSATGVSFADVAGCGEAVEELEDVRSFLQHPKEFERLGARVPKGVLLYGPPGTGKTLLAKAVASEAGIPFYSSSGSEFVEMFAGLGAKRVRQLFQEAKKRAPSIIFIDELDAVGAARTPGGGDGGSREADQTLIQILKEMDGFDVSKHPVIVIGATNRVETLDPALVRPGRFDRHIAIDPPDRAGREEILRVHAQGKKISKSVDLHKIAVQTSGMTGADLSLVLNEAALLAARRGAAEIESRDVDDAYFRVVAGAKKHNRLLSDREKHWIAIHECGHALVGERLAGSDKLHKISIIPRGKSGGQTLYVSEEDIFLYSEQQLRDKICGLLAGRAAEEEILGEISAGAADDLRRASDIAIRMVSELGMSSSVGLRALRPGEGGSDDLWQKINEEVSSLLEHEYQRAQKIVSREEETLRLLAEKLQAEETLDRERFLEIIATT